MPSKRPVSACSANAALISSALVVAGHLAHEVHHRAGDHGRAHGDAVQLAVQLRDHEADRLGGAGGRGHEVDRRRARAAQVLVRAVLEVLVGGVGVDRGHDPALDPDRVVQHACHRRRGSSWCRRRSRSRGAAPGRRRRRSRPARASRRARWPAREMITFFAPAARCFAASSRLVKKPVDSITTSAPTSPQGRAAGSRSANTRSSLPSTTRLSSVASTSPGNGPEDRVVLEQVRERLRVGDVVDTDPVDVGAAGVRGPEDVAADAAEAVDAGLQGHVSASFPSAFLARLKNLAQGRTRAACPRRGAPRPRGSRRGPRTPAPGARRSPPSGGARRCSRCPTVRCDLPSCS